MANPKTKRPLKPTVFLSHSSTNRRELLGLKRLLDERAGGLIDFFLSSDDDSIPHGAIWPAEVRAALDRMSLMLIFISSEALKSGWTYFEAGYGLHKLDSAKIYCLPGSDKGSLPPPFNILQNRNLHSAREVGLLIKQCNDALGASMRDSVSQEELDRIFKKPLMVQLETGPKFEDLVRTIKVRVTGPANSADLFTVVCQKRGLNVSKGTGFSRGHDTLVSTGLRLAMPQPAVDERFKKEVPISEEDRKFGTIFVDKHGESWSLREISFLAEEVTIAEVETYNAKVQADNDEKRKQNEIVKAAPRPCEFELAPTKVSIPIGIVDDWIIAAAIGEPIEVQVYFHREVQRELRMEAVTAKIHGSELSLRADGLYQWREVAKVNAIWADENEWKSNQIDLEVDGANYKTLLSDINLPELVATLFELNIISLPQRARSRRK